VDSLVTSNPGGTDQGATADDHLRLIKATLKRTFPNISGEVVATHTELNRTADLTASAQSQLDTIKTGKLDISATAVYAQSAGGATSAQFATSARSATSARYAASAGAAVTAVSAQFATSATNATNAVNATNATSAVYAASAGAYDGVITAGQVDDASVGGQGVVEFGTTAEYATGTDATRAASIAVLGRPLSKAEDGYTTLPGGILMQWGRTTDMGGGNTQKTVTYPIAFGATPYSVVCTLQVTTGFGAGFVDTNASVKGTPGTTSFILEYTGSSSVGIEYGHWIAIGPK